MDVIEQTPEELVEATTHEELAGMFIELKQEYVKFINEVTSKVREQAH